MTDLERAKARLARLQVAIERLEATRTRLLRVDASINRDRWEADAAELFSDLAYVRAGMAEMKSQISALHDGRANQ